MTSSNRSSQASIVIGGLMSLLIFILFVPVVCVISFADPGPTTQRCDSVLTGFLETRMGLRITPWVSIVGIIVVAPGAGVITWHLLNRRRIGERDAEDTPAIDRKKEDYRLDRPRRPD
jgi:hypothetical protein